MEKRTFGFKSKTESLSSSSQNQTEQIKTTELTIKQLKSVYGDSGTERYSGFFLEEPNSQWRDLNRVDNVEEMRRTDSTIKAVLNAIKSPMMATEWRIEGGDDQQREFVEKCLFNMKRTWKDFIREAFAYLDFGFYVFELIFDHVDGRIGIIDLAPRIPKSINSWELKNGQFGITQYLRTDKPQNTTDEKLQLEIPGEKLLVLTNDKEGDDVTGQSVLRPAYKHYKYKDILYRIQGIAAERYGVGVPVLYMPNPGPETKDQAESMLQNLRSNEKAYLFFPWSQDEGKLEILTPKGNPQGIQIKDAIEHHDRRMLMSVLAGFLGLGNDATGSFALSKDQSSFFLKHVEDHATYFAEQVSKQVIERMINIAFGKQKIYPYLTYNPLGDIDFKEMSEVLKTLIDSGLIEANNKMRKFTNSMFQLPEVTPEEEEEMEAEEMEAELDKAEQEADEFDLPPEPPEEEDEGDMPEEKKN